MAWSRARTMAIWQHEQGYTDMAQTVRKTLADDMKVLMDLVSRNPTPARVTMHMERLLAGWHEVLDPDAYQERLDALQEGLAEGIEQMAEGAADVDPASKAEARNAAAAVETMRTAHRAAMAGGMAPV